MEAVGDLGTGRWGRVCMVRRKLDGYCFADKQVALDAHAARIRHEATLLSRIVHPNVIGYLNYLEADGIGHLLLEAGGPSLHDMETTDPTWCREESLLVLPPVFEAVRYLHEELRVAHRDLNSRNVVLMDGSRPCVCDFGLSVSFSNPHDAMWMSHPSGLWTHASPEMLLGGFHDAFAADAWSLGVLGFLFRHGKLPVELAHSSNADFRQLHTAQALGVNPFEAVMMLHPELEVAGTLFDFMTLASLLRVENRMRLLHVLIVRGEARS